AGRRTGGAAAGATGWGAGTADRVFRKIECYEPGGETRGKSGPMHVEEVAERFPVSDAFLRAAQEDGLPLNPDYNAGRQDGVGYYQVAQRHGRRWSVVDGYLKPAAGRRNLTVECGAHVTRLLFEGKRCVGVAYRKNGQEFTVRARRETLLCLGAVQSPQLLELSGVGSPALLQSFGIPLVHAQPQVGENYIDHFATRMNWRVRNTVTLNEMSRGWRLARQVARYYTRHKGILTLGKGLVHGFVKSAPDLPAADVQYFFVHASYANAAERILDREPGMTIGVAQLRPESVGSIHLKSADPLAAPSIRPNFLSAQVDRDSLVGGMRVARRIVQRPALQRYIERELSPGADVDSDEQWLDFARRNGQTIYHPIGTCRMGADAGAVTDPRLRVNGIAGLRVVDASVMPKMVSGNTQAAVMMVAERGAEMILEDAAAA
ncbi:MAG: GMC family oxidoreductase N-terminal domain-containing protein, partial [Achromobacter sp.]|nr:GMC family oxidoreductase N-terminal domain-containing protein [Achromobacter sp.]